MNISPNLALDVLEAPKYLAHRLKGLANKFLISPMVLQNAQY